MFKINKNTLLYQRTFDKIDILLLGEVEKQTDRMAKGLEKLDNVSIIRTDDLRTIMKKKYDYVNIDSDISLDAPTEYLINKLAENSSYVIVDLKNGSIDEDRLLNKMYYNKTHDMVVIDNSKPRTLLMKFILRKLTKPFKTKILLNKVS